MKVYWSDRNGKGPPEGCMFRIRPFIGAENLGRERAEIGFPTTVQIVKKTFFPTREVWLRGVERALDLIRRKELQKVVLARRCILELERAPDPFDVTASLKERSEGAFVFCAASEKSAFLGASPERLYARKGHHIVSEAMAGTRGKGEEFLKSEKDLREILPVQDYIQNGLSPLCIGEIVFSPISVHQTQNVQHLYSSCSGKLKEWVTDDKILKQLHPTPALCGMPKQKAFSVIRQLEPFERGLYGGAIGWTSPKASEWIVAIRSCLLEGNKATLFSGAGIVEGSDPEKEWDELDQKIKLYDGIFLAH